MRLIELLIYNQGFLYRINLESLKGYLHCCPHCKKDCSFLDFSFDVELGILTLVCSNPKCELVIKLPIEEFLTECPIEFALAREYKRVFLDFNGGTK